MIPTEIKSHLEKDPIIRSLVNSVMFDRSPVSSGVYVDLLGSIISQQLSGKVAAVIESRFLNLFPDKYPAPNLLLNKDVEELRSVGLSYQKSNYLQNVARFFVENDLMDFDFSIKDEESIIKLLTQIKGVGKWTVEMILMFSLNRPDVFPIDDLGIRTAIIQLYKLNAEDKNLKSQMIEIAEKWRPYRSYACYLLWRYKDAK